MPQLSCPKTHVILVPWLGIEPATLALKGRLSTTGLQGKFQQFLYLACSYILGLRWCPHRHDLVSLGWRLEGLSLQFSKAPSLWSLLTLQHSAFQTSCLAVLTRIFVSSTKERCFPLPLNFPIPHSTAQTRQAIGWVIVGLPCLSSFRDLVLHCLVFNVLKAGWQCSLSSWSNCTFSQYSHWEPLIKGVSHVC